MARRAAKQALNASVYRHFAVATLAITVVLAIFSDGEKRTAMAEAMAAQTYNTPEKDKRQTVAGIVDNRSHPAASFGSDNTANFGAPMDDTGGATVIGDYHASANFDKGDTGTAVVPGTYNRYGIALSEWTRMTDLQRQEIIDRYEAEQIAARSETRQQQMENLLAQSRARAAR